MSLILSVITFLVTNPDTLAKGASAVMALVNSAIAIWNAHGAPEETTEELLAEWNANGIDYAAIQAEAAARGM